MESVINRLTSDIQTRLTDRPEAAYADGLSAKLQVAQTKLKQVKHFRFISKAKLFHSLFYLFVCANNSSN